jgi:hypothetical protein
LENGTTKLLETKHDRKHEYLKRVLILFESKSKILTWGYIIIVDKGCKLTIYFENGRIEYSNAPFIFEQAIAVIIK